jgi:O-antigen/teichoic acid export membrane protein
MNILVSAAIGFFMMPFLVHRLGDTLYGIWILIISVTGYGALLDFGIRSSIIKYVAQYHAVNDHVRLNRVFNTSLFVYSLIGLVVVGAAFAFSAYFAELFNIASSVEKDARLAFLIIGINLALKFPFGVFEGFLCGTQKYHITNGISILAGILKAVCIVIFVVMGYKLLTLSLIILITDGIGQVAMAYVCMKYLPKLNITFKVEDSAILKDIYRFGSFSFIIIISTRLLYETDAVLIGLFLPASSITFYAIANNLVKYLRQISFAFGNVFNPAASELEARNEQEAIKQLITYGTKYSLLIILPIATTFIMLGKEFITLWIGSKYAEASSLVLTILTISQVAAMAQFASGSVLYGLNRHRYLSFLLICEALLKLALSVLLVRRHGIVGIALGTAIPEIIVYLFFLPRYISSIAELSLTKYFREAVCLPFATVIPFVSVIYLYKVYLNPLSWISFIGAISIALVIYSVVAWMICFNGREKGEIGLLLIRTLKRGNIAL